MDDGPSEALIEALTRLWRIPAPGPEKLRVTSAFKWLGKTALLDYPGAHNGRASTSFEFALEGALRTLGLPCLLPAGRHGPHVPPAEAARLLDRAFRATQCRRRYLVPLDQAGDLPALTFGPVRLAKFSEAELRELIDATRLERVFPHLPIDTRRFSCFHWLVVEEEFLLDQRPAARASPTLFNMKLARDFGRIEPYKGRFPSPVENALFALLLAPWEEWSTELSPDWRGFRTPWVYSVVEDVFVRPLAPSSVDTLTWDISTHDDEYGETYETLEFFPLPLDEMETARGLALVDNDSWSVVEGALGCPLFETPVVHFFVRAFLSEGIDEFIAHLTTIDAALGLYADHRPSLRPKPDPYPKLKATDRLGARIAALLADSSAANLHKKLFDIRSDYVHGRGSKKDISSKEKIGARSLARRVVAALVEANEKSAPASREEFLSNLLKRGAAMLTAAPAGRAGLVAQQTLNAFLGEPQPQSPAIEAKSSSLRPGRTR
jgi:hypothetical protein